MEYFFLCAPILFVSLSWLVGKSISQICGIDGKLNEGYFFFIGLGTLLVIASNYSFFGLPIDSSTLYPLLFLMLITLCFRVEILKKTNWNEVFLIATVTILVSGHFLVANILAQGTHINVLEAGDFNQYISLGAWLQYHGISDAIDSFGFGDEWNVISENVSDFQRNQIRLGSSLLFALFAKLFFIDVSHAYSAYVAFSVSSLALGVYLFTQSLLSKLNIHKSSHEMSIPLFVSILFGLSPVSVWPALAAFTPQTMGLAFALVLIAGLHTITRQLSDDEDTLLDRSTIFLLAITVFSIWSIYPECFPLLIVIISLVLLSHIIHNRRLSVFQIKRKSKVLTKYLIWIIVVAVLLSPLNFIYGMQGLAEMMKGAPHGGDQVSTLYNLMSIILGLSTMPLGEQTLRLVPNSLVFLPLILFLFFSVFVVVGKERNIKHIVISIISSTILLFVFVYVNYGVVKHGILKILSEQEIQIIVHWNLFKAAQFLAPFLFTIAFTSTFFILTKLNSKLSISGFILLIGMYAVVVYQNDHRFITHSESFSVDKDMTSFINQLPEGRLLINLDTLSRYHRYALYSALVNRPFISTNDAQHDCIKQLSKMTKVEMLAVKLGQHKTNKEINKVCSTTEFFDRPIKYILTDSPQPPDNERVIYKKNKFSIVDVSDETFVFSTKDTARRTYYFLNSPYKTTGTVKLQLFNLLGMPAKIMYADKRQLISGSPKSYEEVNFENVISQKGLNQFYITSESKLVDIVIGYVEPSKLVLHDDLLRMLTDDRVSTDANGNKLKMSKQGRDIKIELDNMGDSRVLLGLNLEAGEYFFNIGINDYQVIKEMNSGFGGYFGPDNNYLTSFELKNGKELYYRYLHSGNQEVPVFFSLGIGGWGKANGSFVVNKLELYKR